VCVVVRSYRSVADGRFFHRSYRPTRCSCGEVNRTRTGTAARADARRTGQPRNPHVRRPTRAHLACTSVPRRPAALTRGTGFDIARCARSSRGVLARVRPLTTEEGRAA